MPGVNVKEGDYVLAVNGRPLDTQESPWAAFAGLAEKTGACSPSTRSRRMDGAREVLVQTLDDETRLRHLAWIEAEPQARRRGHRRQDRLRLRAEHRPRRADRAGAPVHRAVQQGRPVIDERFNSGGQIPDRFIELLEPQAARVLGRARRQRLAVAAGRELRSQGRC